ncbi:MAG: response regulator transcription factor [Bacteroidetes bacterium]|nr:response regulator transcription factor [Bacteroidota bacterium]MBS1740811.1 response regulator transcription factor [Bacteroidota bacterium]MBS1775211.1 response regulator transcription factor [Bacteroidota bacterium]
MDKIRIAIADDHHLLLDGLRALMQKQKEIEIVGLYDNGRALYEALPNIVPQIALVDINMPEMNGEELTRKIKEKYPAVSVIALSMYDDAGHIMEMIEAGVSGYILKNVTDKELLEAVRTVANGRMYFSNEVADKITGIALQHQKRTEGIEELKLTEREKEILKLIAEEMSNAQIAETLFISERTVETHRKNMLRKTNNKTIVGLLKYAFENRII